MKPFLFQQFLINQTPDVFRVGTDGVLLGALHKPPPAKNVLEVGTGTGLIALMAAQRNPQAAITAIDVDENAALLASGNFRKSRFAQRLKALKADFKEFLAEDKFDLILSNPPYFEVDHFFGKDKTARQAVELSFPELVAGAAKNLSERGQFSVIIPAESYSEFKALAEADNLKLFNKINIYGILNGKLKRVLLEFSFNQKPYSESDFTVESAPRQYSEQYLAATKDFHIFEDQDKGERYAGKREVREQSVCLQANLCRIECRRAAETGQRPCADHSL